MNIAAIKTVATRGLHTGIFYGKKYAPEILTGAGVVGVVVGTVLVAKASTKLEPVVDVIQTNLEAVNGEDALEFYGSEKEQTKAKIRIYVQGGVDLVKLYGPGVTTIGVSIVSILAAHGIMRRRNVALVAAYKTVESAFGKYRERVVDELGEEKDFEFYHGVKTEKVEDANGKKKTVKTPVDPNQFSDYSKIFDEGNINYEKVSEYNRQFLETQQRYFNQRLQARGHVFLNDVYRALGFDDTSAGSVVGWRVSKEGDNFIDFGLYNPANSAAARFINGEERSVILDFNVDGVIYDKI